MGGAFGPRRGIILFGGIAVTASLILSPRLLFDMLVCLFAQVKRKPITLAQQFEIRVRFFEIVQCLFLGMGR